MRHLEFPEQTLREQRREELTRRENAIGAANRSNQAGDHGRAPVPGWGECTAYLQTGAWGPAAGAPLERGVRPHLAPRRVAECSSGIGPISGLSSRSRSHRALRSTQFAAFPMRTIPPEARAVTPSVSAPKPAYERTHSPPPPPAQRRGLTNSTIWKESGCVAVWQRG